MMKLEDIQFETVCPASWDEMSGDDKVRECGKCDKQVYNLSAMNRAEAEAFFAEHGANACIRLFRRQDGTVTTADCAPPVPPKPKDIQLLGVPRRPKDL